MKPEMNSRKQYVIPVFDPIKLEDIKPGSALLIYGKNNLTRFHGQYRREVFGRADRVPTHAALFVEKPHWILDPTLKTGFSMIQEYINKGYQIDVIDYYMSLEQRGIALDKAKEIGMREGFYDLRGYGAFASQMPFMSWVSVFIKPSKKGFFCSDAVVYCLQTVAGVQVSAWGNNESAPVDLLLFAYVYGRSCGKIYTLVE